MNNTIYPKVLLVLFALNTLACFSAEIYIKSRIKADATLHALYLDAKQSLDKNTLSQATLPADVQEKYQMYTSSYNATFIIQTCTVTMFFFGNVVLLLLVIYIRKQKHLPSNIQTATTNVDVPASVLSSRTGQVVNLCILTVSVFGFLLIYMYLF